jgi:transposase InsO family protein
MDLGRFLVEAHLREGRPVAELAAAHGVHRSWIYKLLARYRAAGDTGLQPRSRRPLRSPTRISDLYEDEIVALRKELAEDGFDAGAVTIHTHLSRRHNDVPSVSTIWRVLKDRGFVVPQPHKRPRSSLVRFVADLPNECWQMDVTHVELAGGQTVEVLNVIDDHSRLCVSSMARTVFTSPKVVSTFYEAAGQWGLPASVLSDNGAIFTASYRNGVAAMESSLLSLGIEFKHSRPYHPQTCGKVERFHQTVKKYLAKQDPPTTTRQLQAQLDRFVAYYNEVRPHRAIGRRTPREAFEARTKASPRRSGIHVDGYRIRHDKVDKTGKVTVRYRSKLHHIGLGRALTGKRIILLTAGPKVRVIHQDGRLIRELTIDPKRNYQARR